MLRQLTAQGLKAVAPKQGRRFASLAAAEACELSAPGCSGAVDARAPVPHGAETLATCLGSYFAPQALHQLPPRWTARLEIWRHCSTTAAASVAQRPVVLLARAASLQTDSAPTRKHPAASKAVASTDKKAAASKKTKPTKATRGKTSARGTAVAERRRTTSQDQVKAVRARAAESVAKVKARAAERTNKLREEVRSRVADAKAKAQKEKADAIAKVKAEAEAKLKAALEKAEAKLARAEAMVKGKKRVKKAPSAFNLYVKDQMKGNPQLAISDASKLYKVLSEAEKQKYVDAAAAAKAEVEKQREKLATEGATRRPVPAYIFFAIEQRPAVQAGSPNASLSEVSKRLGDMWRGLSAEQRQRYVDMEDADRKAKGLPPVPPKTGSTTDPAAAATGSATGPAAPAQSVLGSQ